MMEASFVTRDTDCSVQVVVCRQDQPQVVIEGRAKAHVDALSGARIQLGILHQLAAVVDHCVTAKNAKAGKVGVLKGQGISLGPFAVRTPAAVGVRHHVRYSARIVHPISP